MSNFNKNKASMFDHSKQRWGLRKLSVGVASVLLGFTFMGVQAQQASADANTDNAGTNETVTAPNQATAQSQVVLAASQNQQDNVSQNFVIPDGYANAMNGFRPNGANSTPAIISASTKGISENGGDPAKGFETLGFNGNIVFPASNYQHNAKDAAETVDLQNLTPAQESEITTFAAQTINQLRSRVQAQPNGNKVSAGFVKVSPFATQAGYTMVHAAYDNFNGDGHNMTGLEAAAKKMGINAWVGENIGGMLVQSALNAGWVKTINMDQLKQNIYLVILAMMYSDNGSKTIGAGGHTTALLNDPSFNLKSRAGGNAISLDANGNVVANQYLALTFDKKGNAHFNFISDADASADAKAKLALNAVQPVFAAVKPGQGSQSSSAASSATSSAQSSATSSAQSSATSSAQSSATSSAQSSATSSATSSAMSSAQSSATSSAQSSATSSAQSSATSSAQSSATSSAQSSAASSVASEATNSGEINANNSDMFGNTTDHNNAATNAASAEAGNNQATASATVTAEGQGANATKTAAANQTLPQTGNNKAVSLVALGMVSMSAMLGLGLRKKRN